jgi:hypothetical protein
VLCHVAGLDNFIAWLDDVHLPSLKTSNRRYFSEVLVLSLGDRHLKQISPISLSRAKELFSRIYIEANDGSDPAIKTFPIALLQRYLNGVEPTLGYLLQNPPPKTDLLLASWGKAWPHLNEKIPDRAAAYEFANDSEWLEFETLTTEDYLTRLARSKYMLYPRGNGIQSPKGFEALLLGAIPIVTDHPSFRELAERGMPFLIVNSWGDVTETLLQERYEDLKQRVDYFGQIARDQKSFFRFACELD